MMNDHESAQPAAAPSTNAAQPPAVAPGMRTRVGQLAAPEGVQFAGGAVGGEPAAIHAQADAGTAGAGGPLPFAATLQRAFGAHDLSAVRAHTDGAAADANAAMGSRAFARGNDIAFGGPPDLHTAAHEAAHVVQQRGGVALKGGVGAAGDPYERHADAVADVVVAGGSAEGLLTEMAGPPRGAGAGTGAIQHAVQFDQGAVATEGAPTASEEPAQPVPTGTPRVRAACAARDLAALRAVQTELVNKLRADPTDPDAREGVATARTWTMDRVAELRDGFAPRIAAAQVAHEGETDTPGQRVEAVEKEMDAACTPYLDLLMAGDPQYRYLHVDPAVQDKVFAAVQLHALRRGLSQIGHRGDAEKESRAEGHLGPKDDWCGAFAYTQAEKGGGMDPHWAGAMQGEQGIRDALAYKGADPIWIWAFDHWESLPAYHAARGSLRHYEAIAQAPPSFGIRPGDIVLIDNAYGTNPDHITTALSFDGRYLTTLGGNQGPGEKGVSRSEAPIDISKNAVANDVTDYKTKEVDEHGNRKKVPRTDMVKNWRVHGIGRWSVVDFETHVYATGKTMPTKPASSSQLARAQGGKPR